MPGPRLLLLVFLALALSGVATAGNRAMAATPNCCNEVLGGQAHLPSPGALAPVLAKCKSAPCPQLARALTLMEQGKLDQARTALVEASKSAPESPYPHYYLGEVALRGGDAAGAVTELSAAIRLRSNFAGAHALLGQAQIAAGEVAKGLSALRTAIALAPGLAEGHLILGRAYFDTGRPEHAVIELERAIELDSECFEARYLLARAQMNAGDLESGFAALEAYVREASSVPGESERVSRAQEILRDFARSSQAG